MYFITVLNEVVTGVHSGDIGADLFGTPYYGHDRVEVPSIDGIRALDDVRFYSKDWQRKSDCLLIDEGLIPMPEGYIREENSLRKMTLDERIIAGLDEPQPGYKVKDGEIVTMTLKEKLAADLITQDEYNKQLEAENTVELQQRLAELQTPEAIAEAEVDEEFAAERKAALAALLAVKKQPNWPLEVKWPK